MAASGRRTPRSRVKSLSGAGDGGESKFNTNFRKMRAKDNALIRMLKVNLWALLGFGIITFSIAVFVIYYYLSIINSVDSGRILRVVTPFPAPKMMDLPQVWITSNCMYLVTVFVSI